MTAMFGGALAMTSGHYEMAQFVTEVDWSGTMTMTDDDLLS